MIAHGPGWEGLGDLVATAASLSNTIGSDPLDHVQAGYRRFRRYAPRMLRTLDIEASPVAKPCWKLWTPCAATARPGRPTSSGRIRSGAGRLRIQPDRRHWETAVLFHLRDAFRSGDVWLARSRRYGDIRNALLSTRAVVDAECMPVPANPDDWLAERKAALDEGLRRLDIATRSGANSGVSIENGTLRIEKTEAGVPDGTGDLVLDLYRRIPDARITDILLEVDDATRFTEAFTHLRTGAPCRDRVGFSTCCSPKGSTSVCARWPMRRPRTGSWELMRIARWHVEGEAFERALSMVVEAQAALPMATFWGTGRAARATASSSPPPAGAKP